MNTRNIRMIETNGISLKVIVEGSGPVGVLLHGFPQAAYLWRNQIDDSVAAGYQVAVPDQRGYGGSDKPTDPQAYDTVTLSADAVGIADALGHETLTLVTARLGCDRRLVHGLAVSATSQRGVRAERAADDGVPAGAITRQENFGDNFVDTVYFERPESPRPNSTQMYASRYEWMIYAYSGDGPVFSFLRPNRPSRSYSDGLLIRIRCRSRLTDAELDQNCEDYRDGSRGPINWYRSTTAASS